AADSTRDERFEQAGPQVFRDARAVVAHGQGYGSLDAGASRQLVRGGSSGAYYDAGALPRGLDGVQHQVRHHSVQQVLVALHRGRFALQRSEEHTLNSSHRTISYAVFCLKKKNNVTIITFFTYSAL